MIKVLIAEDEPPIARALSRMVEESSPTFKVVACESNGQSALKYMRRDTVDMVLTDIRMPVMDGLELLKAIRSGWPDCLTVIVSGHQDFEYAQTALRLGAFDYLLKPISREKLREMLDRLEDAYAHNLLQEAVHLWRVGGKTPAFDMSILKDASYTLILAIAGHWPSIADDALSPGAVFWQINDPQVLIRETLGQASGAVTFAGRAAAERVFLLENTTFDRAVAIAGEFLEKLTQLSPLPKTVCVVHEPLSFDSIAAAIRTARKRVYSQIKLCSSALLQEPEYNTDPGGAARSLSPDTLAEALCVRSEKQISFALGAAIDTAVRYGLPQVEFEHFLDAVIHDKRLSFDAKSLKEELNEAIVAATSPAGLKADLTQILSQYVLGESKSELKGRVDQISQYLAAHYAEEISSETLSSRFGFVSSYLSKVFRRQTGVSPTEYLTKLRIEKAKELLKTQPGMLIRDAAALVGYKDPYYFSKLFRKSTGQWPSQYQRQD